MPLEGLFRVKEEVENQCFEYSLCLRGLLSLKVTHRWVFYKESTLVFSWLVFAKGRSFWHTGGVLWLSLCMKLA